MVDERDEPDWAAWAEAWERHMTGFLPQRGSALDLLADLVAELVGSDAEVVELGAGIGSLAERLVARLPGGRVLALELDPLLRRIGQERTEALADRLAWASADLTQPSWDDALPGRLDAAVTVATLHGIGEEVTRQVYRRLGERLGPDGVLVNLDFASSSKDERIGAAVTALTTRRNERAGATVFRNHRERLAADPVLGPLADERDRLLRIEERRAAGVEDPPYLDLDAHRRELLASGFRDVDVPWRELDLAMLVAVR